MDLTDRLASDRAAASAHLAALLRDFDALVAASEASNADDEHDPEGATIGFERAQLSALIAQTRVRVEDLDRSREQVSQGGYGVCEQCAGPIGDERLVARPSARRCITCAS